MQCFVSQHPHMSIRKPEATGMARAIEFYTPTGGTILQYRGDAVEQSLPTNKCVEYGRKRSNGGSCPTENIGQVWVKAGRKDHVRREG